MPDISMCSGVIGVRSCPRLSECYRHEAVPSLRQSYYAEAPMKDDGSCDHHMPIWPKRKP